MLHHYFYNSMNNKKVQFILREKVESRLFLRKYDIVKRVRYTQKRKEKDLCISQFMFCAGGISIEEIIAYRNDYIFNFSC